MNLQTFFDRYHGEKVDFDGAYGDQCVDLFAFYNRDVVGNPNRIGGNAYQLYDRLPAAYYRKKITEPQKGDIAFWRKEFGGYGHVAIVWDSGKFFSQNYPIGSPCALRSIPTAYIMGYARPINSNNMTDYAKEFNNQTVITSEEGDEKGKWYWIKDGQKRLIPDRKTGWAFGLLQEDVRFISAAAIKSIPTGEQLKYWDGPYYRFIEEITRFKKDL